MMESPWSTKIVDTVIRDEREKLLFKLWIWSDRIMWSSVSVVITCGLVALLT